MKPLLIHGFFVTGAVSLLIAQPAATQVVQETEQPLKQTSSNSFDAIADSLRLTQDFSDKTDLTPLAPIPYKGMGETTSPLLAGEGLGERLSQKYSPVSEIEFSPTSIQELTQQPRGIPSGITSLQANSQTVAQVSEAVVQVTGVQLRFFATSAVLLKREDLGTRSISLIFEVSPSRVRFFEMASEFPMYSPRL